MFLAFILCTVKGRQKKMTRELEDEFKSCVTSHLPRNLTEEELIVSSGRKQEDPEATPSVLMVLGRMFDVMNRHRI